MKTLIILAHPDIKKSRINQAMINAVKTKSDLTISDIYGKYKDFNIDIASEQKLILEHDRILFQFPIFWYSYPPLLKKYFDDVLVSGFAFGNNGKALDGKEVRIIISFGAKEEFFHAEGMVGFSVEEILIPFRSIMKFVGADYKGHFGTFGASYGLSDAQLDLRIQDYKKLFFE